MSLNEILVRASGRTKLHNSRNVAGPQLLNNTARFLESSLISLKLKSLYVFTPFVSGRIKFGNSSVNSCHPRRQNVVSLAESNNVVDHVN